MNYNDLTDEQKKEVDRKIEVRRCFGEAYKVSGVIVRITSKIHTVFFAISILLIAVGSFVTGGLFNAVTGICIVANLLFFAMRYGSALVQQFAYSAYWNIKIDVDKYSNEQNSNLDDAFNV